MLPKLLTAAQSRPPVNAWSVNRFRKISAQEILSSQEETKNMSTDDLEKQLQGLLACLSLPAGLNIKLVEFCGYVRNIMFIAQCLGDI